MSLPDLLILEKEATTMHTFVSRTQAAIQLLLTNAELTDNSHKRLQHITCVKINEFNNDTERQQHIDQFLRNLLNIVSNSENQPSSRGKLSI